MRLVLVLLVCFVRLMSAMTDGVKVQQTTWRVGVTMYPIIRLIVGPFPRSPDGDVIEG